MEKILDMPLEYKGVRNCDSICHLRVYDAPTRPTVVIVTELLQNQGTSISNRIKELATQVYALLERPARGMVWVEHYGVWEAAAPYPRQEEIWVMVALDQNGRHFRNPRWLPMTRAEVETLIGQPVETGEV